MLSRAYRPHRATALPTQRKNTQTTSVFARTFATATGKKVAVVLSGCGVFDGTEVTEAASAMINFSRAGHQLEFFAPSVDQTDVVDHVSGKVDEYEERDAFLESARITRGKLAKLRDLKVEEYDALFLPGGFGAAKTLSNYASAGAECQVIPDLEKAIRDFHGAGKPVGACCIAPVLVARVLGTKAGGPGVKVTVGADEATMKNIEDMGSVAVTAEHTEITIDEDHGIVTTPAYMYNNAAPHQIYDGIATLVTKLFSVQRNEAAASDALTDEFVSILRQNADKLGMAERFNSGKKEVKEEEEAEQES